MERVAFLTPDGQRVFAMVNPEELTFERQSGVRNRGRHERPLASARRSDDPLIYVGGGTTDLRLNLLFDVDLLTRSSPSFAQAPDFRTNLQAPPASAHIPISSEADDAAQQAAPVEPAPAVTDVRDLSGPLWRLTENGPAGGLAEGPPVVHFIWGAAWNMPCVAISIAERFDQFSAAGCPTRSWMRIHLRRTQLPPPPRGPEDTYTWSPRAEGVVRSEAPAEDSFVLTDPLSSGRPDLLCSELYRDARMMRPLLEYNDIDDFWSIEPGRVLRTPPVSVLREQSQ